MEKAPRICRNVHTSDPDKKIIVVGIHNQPELITQYIEAGLWATFPVKVNVKLMERFIP